MTTEGSQNDWRLLSGQNAEPSLVGYSCLRELVIGRKPCRVRRLRQLALGTGFLRHAEGTGRKQEGLGGR